MQTQKPKKAKSANKRRAAAKRRQKLRLRKRRGDIGTEEPLPKR